MADEAAKGPALPGMAGPSYLELRARHAAAAPVCYTCFEIRQANAIPERSGAAQVMLAGPPLLLGAAALLNPEAARATIGAVGTFLTTQPARPTVSVATALFPEAVPGYDQEVGLALPSSPVPAALAAGRGVRAGAFVVQPAVTLGGGYDSNVLGVRGGPGGPTITTGASLSLSGDYSRGRLGGFAGVDSTIYPTLPNQTRTDLRLALGTTVAIGRGEATVAFSHLELHDDPAAIGSIPSSTPTPFSVDDIRASVNFVLGRLSLQPFADYSHWSYGGATVGGVTVDQRFRDRDVMQAGVAARFNVAERRDLLASVSYARTEYKRAFGAAPAPSSNGVLLLAGVDWELDGALRLRALAGVQARAFVNGVYRDRVVPVGQVAAVWTPQRQTAVTLTLARSLEDLAQEDTGGTIFSRAEVAVAHEARRDLTLKARAGVQTAEFLQVGGTQASVYGGVGFQWAINRAWRLTGDAEARRISAPVTGGALGASAGPYTRIQTGLSLTTSL